MKKLIVEIADKYADAVYQPLHQIKHVLLSKH